MPKRKKQIPGIDDEFLFVKKSDVPFYLQNGEFYKSLSEADDEPIQIPINTLKADEVIKNNTDLEHLLSSLRFWGVDDVSEDVVSFCRSGKGRRSIPILNHYCEQFPYIEALKTVLSGPEKDQSKSTIASGLLDLVRLLFRHGVDFSNGCNEAVKCGQVEILKFLHDQGEVIDASVFETAIAMGHLSCVTYIHSLGLSWPTNTLNITLVRQHIECFHYALQSGCPWPSSSILPCSNLCADMLRYAICHGHPVNRETIIYAAMNGAIKCLQVLHEANCPWDETVCREAVAAGSLECLQYLHENGCPWDEDTVVYAIIGRQLECLQYAHEHACPAPAYSCLAAAESGFREILQYLHESGFPWGVETPEAAALHGHLDCLQYAHEHGCPWDESTCAAAAQEYHLECLQYAYEHGCPVNADDYQRVVKQIETFRNNK